MKYILVFGISGQDGYYVNQIGQEKGFTVIGVSRTSLPIAGDVSSFECVSQLVKDYKPIYIFHLAANSTTHHNAVLENHETISTGTLNILEAVKQYSPNSKVFITGSGVQFENTGVAIDESTAFEASSAYAVARIQSVYAARYYRTLGIKAYVGYLFHHESAMRKNHHVSQKIVRAIQQLKMGKQVELELGDISVAKEWSYAGDIVHAMFTLLEQDIIFEVVIGSGELHTIEEWLNVCFKTIGLDWQDHTKVLKDYKAEYKTLLSNPMLIKKMGWTPQCNFEAIALKMINEEM
ncbi:MAG: GDP-mannose 4,6-dehydratase [Gammaproteobacteria bacterium]|nr:GDP-mannose 4,6-dehydratase [Gammaproteobacteria bacterium]